MSVYEACDDVVSRRELANALRILSLDAVQRANSGHPGAPMGMADIAEVLWRSYLKHNPADPAWSDRDRFVLSNGHGSMLLYSLLHLSGYDLALEDLKAFRQLGSRTPGHPEYGYTPGVETTTGPLGQGLANAVGMALAEKTQAARFNRPGYTVVDHFTYVFLGDGCLMEGISHEVCSLAGTQQLGKLIAFYDDNRISIDGDVQGWFTDDTPARFRAYGWQVLEAVDGHDAEAVAQAIEQARAETRRPTLICCKTVIGFGSPNKAGTHDCHGAPLGEEEIALTRKALGWPHPPFEVPAAVYQAWSARAAGSEAQRAWERQFDAYRTAHPALAAEFLRCQAGRLPDVWSACRTALERESQAQAVPQATRKSSQETLEVLGPVLPELLGGSADLAPSNLTLWRGSQAIAPERPDGNYLHYGVREFGMSAIMNGMALHGGFRPYGGTFLMFMEYARNAVRMAALMKARSIFVYTHDSIGLGEDGPTHQPVEQLASLRQTPGLETWRPCDKLETAVAWCEALEREQGPSALVLSRQNLPPQARNEAQVAAVRRGGYLLRDCGQQPELILLATGSEVGLAQAVAEVLAQEGRAVNVISLPCVERFLAQEASYQEAVLPAGVTARVAIECGRGDAWYRFTGHQGAVISLDSFGESGAADALMAHFGFTVDAVLARVREVLASAAG